jgi:hypothetical protein
MDRMTIEDIVRQKARKELERELNQVFNPVKALLWAFDDEDIQPALKQIAEMRERCIAKFTPEREQNAVNDFASKVMAMKEGA